jgi:N-acetylglucosaminyldiphosphoundecaprenol N-acetyl-beta-D-mannosaminyltransferase
MGIHAMTLTSTDLELGGFSARRDRLIGMPVDALSMDETVELLARAIELRRRCRIMVTNANKTWLARRDARLAEALEQADLVIPEWATVWAARMLRREGFHHVGGLMLMVRLLDEATARGWSVYFLGAQQHVVDRLVEVVAAERPALRIAGAHHGYLDDASDAHLKLELARLQPDILFIAMGSPRQELWMLELPQHAATITIGVGGSFDVLAGFKKDAPAWMRGRGLEWLFRLSQDPRNLWRRYAVTNPWFVWQVLRERVRGPRPL